jgi:hypothetical protein
MCKQVETDLHPAWLRVASRSGCMLLAAGAVLAGERNAGAVESTMMLYALGSGALGAGQTAPPGFYFTTVGAYNQWKASKDITFGGVSVKANIYMPAMLGSMMFVIPDEILGGRLAITAISGVANIKLNAGLENPNLARTAQGSGGTDTTLRASLGWNVGPNFSHKVTFTTFVPTGRYDKGFYPNIGLNRLGGDFSWGATYLDPNVGFEVSGTVGYTLEGYNGLTAYRSGNAVHFEQGVAQHFPNGFKIGLISYQYLQTSPDGGTGAVLGPFKTRAIGVGPSVGYTTMIGGHLVIISAQATREVATANRLRQTGGLLSTTVKF